MKTITPTPPAHCTFEPEDWLRLARCWHPVARACDIAGAPVKATLLDEQLVIYRIKGQVVVARDVCPHRGVPLTLGFHEEEGIVCPYHGLRFGEDGRCNRIPSSPGQPIPAKLHLTSFAVEERYGLMERFVAQYVRDNPSEEGMEAANTTLAWIEFLRENGVEHAYATGSIAEVLADVNDRVSSQTQQLASSVGWSKDILEMQLQQDSLRMEVGARLDSLERSFTRIVVVAEHLPEISDRVLDELNKQVTQLIYTMNYSVDNAFADFDRQRDELQRYVTGERQALVEQLRQTAGEVVRTTLDAVPGLVGKVLLYVVSALAVLIGGPFALGFWLGGVRARAGAKRKE